MWRFAFRNLWTRPVRTVLGLVGLSIPIVGVLGLISLSSAMKNLLGETLGQVQGMMVLREDAPVPILSHLRADLEEKIRKVPGVRLVAAEVWETAPPIEGASLFRNLAKLENWTSRTKRIQSLLDASAVLGQDIEAHLGSRTGVYAKSIKEGRFLTVDDRGRPNVVISRKIARRYPDAEGRPKKVGDPLRIGDEEFRIVGVYDTGSMFFDDILVMDIGVARKLLGLAPEQVSCFYVEAEEPDRMEDVARAIEAAAPGVDALNMRDFQANFGSILGEINNGLMLVVGLALLVGVVGIVNTMLMSTMERFAEFGVLRTNGWTRKDVLKLITAESAFLGLAAGLLGCSITLAAAAVANRFLSGGLKLSATPGQVAIGLGLSVVMGTVGGLYPAWKASRLAPMEAFRAGSR
jgi:putative ABC transport system permease protein